MYVPPVASGARGHLLFRRDGTLMAQLFDPARLAMSGDMFPVAEQVGASGNTQNGAFSASENGLLAYRGGLEQGRELVWVDRTGKHISSVGSAGLIAAAALSPDERSTSFAVFKRVGETSDLWLHDVGTQRTVATDLPPGNVD